MLKETGTYRLDCAREMVKPLCLGIRRREPAARRIAISAIKIPVVSFPSMELQYGWIVSGAQDIERATD
jgi:hypothetical protein